MEAGETRDRGRVETEIVVRREEGGGRQQKTVITSLICPGLLVLETSYSSAINDLQPSGLHLIQPSLLQEKLTQACS